MNSTNDMVFIRIAPPTTFSSKIQYNKDLLKMKKWARDNLSYDADWGIVAGNEVGIFLKPEDATMFKLLFNDLQR